MHSQVWHNVVLRNPDSHYAFPHFLIIDVMLEGERKGKKRKEKTRCLHCIKNVRTSRIWNTVPTKINRSTCVQEHIFLFYLYFFPLWSPYLFLGCSSVGLQVYQSEPSPSCVNIQDSGPGGPRPVTALLTVPPRPSSRLQLRTLQGNLSALRDTLLQLRDIGRPLWSAVPVQQRGAQEFRYNSTAWWKKWKMQHWAHTVNWKIS